MTRMLKRILDGLIVGRLLIGDASDQRKFVCDAGIAGIVTAIRRATGYGAWVGGHAHSRGRR